MLALVLAACLPTTSTPAQGPDASEYVTRFASALAAFDAGRHEAAAVLFVRAGEHAPDAPVWRMHAAAALLRARREAEAREHGREALRRGYPPSDLAAIDRRLLPAETLEIDLAPEPIGTVVRLGPRAVPGQADVRVAGDLAVVGSIAYDLVTGDVVATRRPRTRRVVGHVTYPDGRHEEILHPTGPAQWDHVDGRVAFAPSTARAREGPSLSAPVASLAPEHVLRGLRTGFWTDAAAETGRFRFLDGADLAWFVGASRGDWGTCSAVLDVDALTVGAQPVDAPRDASVVQDAEVLEAVGRVLGAPLGEFDRVQRFEGLAPLVVTREDSYLASKGAPLLVVDLDAGEVVARPPLSRDAIFGADPTAAVLSADAGTLLVSNRCGSTIEAFSTRTWRVVWREPWQSNNGWGRRIRTRGERVYSWASGPLHSQVHDVRTGDLVFDGVPIHATMVDGSADDRWAVAQSWGAHYLLDGEDFEPVLEVWVEPSGAAVPHLCAVGSDGVFAVPEARVREARVLAGGRFVPAVDVAPWLWDPLHLRSLREDEDRAPRRVPVAR